MKYLKHILIALTLLSFVFIGTDYQDEKAKTARIQEDHRLELLDQKLQLETIQERLTVAIIGNSALRQEIMGATHTIPTAVALYEDQLSTKMLKTDTTFTMVSGTYNNGASSLASSTYAFIVDEGTASEEMIIADCTATACTGAVRGIDRLTGDTEITALKFSHRRGASIKITDGPQLLILSRIINGDETIPNIFEYTDSNTFTSANELVSYSYVNNVALQGAATGTDSQAGIVELATAIEAASSTDFGAARPLVLQAKYATSSPDTTTTPLIVMAEVGGKIKQAWLDLTEAFTVTGVWLFSSTVDINSTLDVTGTSTFATTTVPDLTVSGTSTLINLTVDGTNIDALLDGNTTILHKHTIIFGTGATTTTGTTVITHNLGIIPSLLTLEAAETTTGQYTSTGYYDGTNQSVIYCYQAGNPNPECTKSDSYIGYVDGATADGGVTITASAMSSTTFTLTFAGTAESLVYLWKVE